MVIEEIAPKLPKQEQSVERAYKNCCNAKKFIEVNSKEFSAYLEKAKSDLSKIEVDYKNESWDWAIIKSYYSIHHAINALLVRFKGFYSKDHICSILALKHFKLIPDEVYARLRKINAKFSDFTGFDVGYILRKISQYDVIKWKKLSKIDADSIYSLAKEIVFFAEKICYK